MNQQRKKPSKNIHGDGKGRRIYMKSLSNSLEGELAGVQQELSEILLAVYPVGSIYMSVTNTNPGTLFGGTWVEWGSGRVPVGVNSSDTDFDTVEEEGGTKSVTLTSAQSGVPAHAHGLNSHTHGLNSHTHSLNSHTHSIPALSGSAASNGAHNHELCSTLNGSTYYLNNAVEGPGAGDYNGWYVNSFSKAGSSNGTFFTSSRGAHTHTVTTTASTTGQATGNTGAATGSTAAASGDTANNTAANATQAHTNLQPYITCYMWKRTA